MGWVLVLFGIARGKVLVSDGVGTGKFLYRTGGSTGIDFYQNRRGGVSIPIPNTGVRQVCILRRQTQSMVVTRINDQSIPNDIVLRNCDNGLASHSQNNRNRISTKSKVLPRINLQGKTQTYCRFN